MKQFIFQTPPNILIEAGASSKIADVLKGHKAARRRDLDRWRA
ncbi:iron-containing alcohol dehydrogenase [Rhizobium leguminosarum]|nr:iron-containing alcohol dehydrogenase [Rhizobium leguminosarum]